MMEKKSILKIIIHFNSIRQEYYYLLIVIW